MVKKKIDSAPEKKVSVKNTKNEIYQAYKELLLKVSEAKEVTHQDEIKIKQKKEIIKNASEVTLENIAKQLSQVKLNTGKAIDSIEVGLINEQKKLNNLKEAIKIESKNLEELYNIKTNADSLSALFLAQKEYKEKFEEKKRVLLKEWEIEKEKYYDDRIYLKEENRKRRMREEEEYQYKHDLKNKKLEDEYKYRKELMNKELNEKKETVLKDLEERELSMKSREDELQSLKEQVEKLPEDIKNAVKKAEDKTRLSLEQHYKHKIALDAAEIAGERNLNKQTIATLKAKIEEQENLILQLTNKSDAATKQVQSIAIKALEGTSKAHFIPANESKKQVST